MTVNIVKSACVDCGYIDNCQTFKRHNKIDNRHIFVITIDECSMKNYDRTWHDKDGEGGLYYCPSCIKMHNVRSEIGQSHRHYEIGYDDKNNVK